jgi:hypothetical protein
MVLEFAGGMRLIIMLIDLLARVFARSLVQGVAFVSAGQDYRHSEVRGYASLPPPPHARGVVWEWNDRRGIIRKSNLTYVYTEIIIGIYRGMGDGWDFDINPTGYEAGG